MRSRSSSLYDRWTATGADGWTERMSANHTICEPVLRGNFSPAESDFDEGPHRPRPTSCFGEPSLASSQARCHLILIGRDRRLSQRQVVLGRPAGVFRGLSREWASRFAS